MFLDILILKSSLWSERLEHIKNKKSQNWTISHLDKVIKSLKKNQTRDPSGMINELLLPGVMGPDMKKAVLSLMNGVKNTGYFPPFMQMADICTIFKNRGSRLEMQNDRGVFILGVLKKAFDKMIYEDKYDHIALGMSDSNVGAQRKKNIKNHLFVVHGVIKFCPEE